jgi:hypothetical protein
LAPSLEPTKIEIRKDDIQMVPGWTVRPAPHHLKIKTIIILMLLVRACATPETKTHPGAFKLPKRLARARRVAESKRMDSFKEIHEALKKTAKQEQAFIRDFFDKTRDMWKEDHDEAEDEAEDENVDKE